MGNWVAVWQSSEQLAGNAGRVREILAAISTDNGSSWSPPTLLNTNGGLLAGNAQVTTDGLGNWVAVWESRGSTLNTDSDIFVTISTNNGGTWSAPSLLNTNGNTDTGHDWRPQITTDGLGNWVAVWTTDDDLGGALHGDWYNILTAISTDNGVTFSDPVPLSIDEIGTIPGDDSAQITTDGLGNWVAVWQSNEKNSFQDFDILVATSIENGDAWSEPTYLDTNAYSDIGDDKNPQVTTDGLGHWVAVWESRDNLGNSEDEDFDIYVATSKDKGVTWTAPTFLNDYGDSDTLYDFSPQITTDGLGQWIAVWWSYDHNNGTPVGDIDNFYAISMDNGATWSAPALLNTNGNSDSGADYYPQIATDGLGHWVAVWALQENLGGPVAGDHDIYYSTSFLPPVLHVDFATGSPMGSGGENNPVDSLGTALSIAKGGFKVRINAGSTSETALIDLDLTLERNGSTGTVIIGASVP